MKKYLAFIFLTSICFIQTIKLTAQETLTSPYLDSTIVEIMETGHLAGISACIIKNDEIGWIGNYGFANIEQQIPVDTTTLFYMASVSKTVTATALMQLWEDGLFELDDDINDYLPFDVHVPNYPSIPITFRMLCTHTSCIKDNDAVNPYYWGEDSPIPLGQFLYDYLDPEGANYFPNLNFYNQSPGTAYHYSNVASALAGCLVEVIGDSTFSYQTKNRIFDPLQMNETAWFLSEVDTTNLAMPYYWNGSDFVPYGYYALTTYPAGALRTSVNQLANFLLSYMNGGTWMGEQILQSSTIDTIMTAQIPNINPNRGIFWYKKFLGGRWLWGHEGINLGAMTSMRFYPEENTGVIIFSNTADEIGYEIIDLLFDYASDSIPCSCLPEGITFTTQAQIDSFQVNYPGCTEIEGDVKIGTDGFLTDITNLNDINVLTSILGSLEICYNPIINLSGLENLTSIGGLLKIYGNHSLINLSGLDNLNTVGSLSIGAVVLCGYYEMCNEGNDSLISFNGLNNLSTISGDMTVLGNHSLSDFDGLEALTSITGSLNIGNDLGGNDSLVNFEGLNNLTFLGGLYLKDNQSLLNFSGIESLNSISGSASIIGGYGCSMISLEGLNNIESVYGDLSISNTSLTGLTGLENLNTIEGSLTINSNHYLSFLTGLESLTTLDNISISGNDVLSDLYGLVNLSTVSIGNIVIFNNPSLSSCDADWLCEYLGAPGGIVNIFNNSQGCNSVIEAGNGCGGNLPCLPQGNYIFCNQTDIDQFQSVFPGCENLEGSIRIKGDDIENLYGLSVMTSLSGNLLIKSNNSLTDFTGLENLTSIGGKLEIRYNHNLLNLTGLEGLNSIGDDLEIEKNNGIINLTGLNNLADIGSDLIIGDYPSYGNNSLIDLSGLENLNTVGGDINIEQNYSLASLEGIGNVSNFSGTILLCYNANLNICATNAICNLINQPGVSKIIYDNGPFCNNFQDIQGACSCWPEGLTLESQQMVDLFPEINPDCAEIEGDLIISNNPNGPLITDLSNLSDITAINGDLNIYYNTQLTNLIGLHNIDAGTITNLTIAQNHMLSTCEVSSVCDYLAAPNGIVTIYNNSPGCNSPEEILDSCNITGQDEKYNYQTLIAYPNPVYSTLNLEVKTMPSQNTFISIFNSSGQELIKKKLSGLKTEIDISYFPASVYVLKIQDEYNIIVKKIIKQSN